MDDKMRTELQLIRAHAWELIERIDKLLVPMEVQKRREETAEQRRLAQLRAQVIAKRNANLQRSAERRQRRI